MIFSDEIRVHHKDDFLELVNLYVRIIEATAEKNGHALQPSETLSDSVIGELLSVGIISKAEQSAKLKFWIGDLYERLIPAVEFYLSNKMLFGDILDKISNQRRRELQTKAAKSDKPRFVDFFAGAGGLSCGFTQAGFLVSLANDFEEVCVNTYILNHPEIPASRVIKEDIRKIVNNITDYITEDVDVVVGGPPCQGFSSANQQRIIDDPRNELYKYYVSAVSQIKPKFFVMENVRGMLKVANQVVEDFGQIKFNLNGEECTYLVSYKLLNSVDFSVSQSRERLIYIGIRSDVAKAKDIKPEQIFDEIAKANEGKPQYLLSDALAYIRPLDAPRIKNQNEIDSETCGKKVDVNAFSGTDNPYLTLINGGRTQPLLFNHKARYVNDINYDIYRLLNQGDDASDPKIADIMPYKNRLHCFKDKYYKLIADRPSRTITAHLRMDCHSHIHPFQIRAITPREAARIQSFPDDYVFLGAYLKTYMEVGNAVPPIMAKTIANVIKRYL